VIIARSPLRISLGGGGTDLPSYYKESEGYTLSLAIDKYVYVSVSRPFFKEIRLKYSKMETTHSVQSINHPIIREAISYFDDNETQIEITSFADVPAGTGLGSSGSFTTALMLSLSNHYQATFSKEKLAFSACDIEINKLSQPVGKQDQYISTYGGLSGFRYKSDGSVGLELGHYSEELVANLQSKLLLYFTGITRNANQILQEQESKTLDASSDMRSKLDQIKYLGFEISKAIAVGDFALLGSLMNQHWKSKLTRSPSMSSQKIEAIYNHALANGAYGGKLVGAGGGGFLLFVSEDHIRLREAMLPTGLQELRFGADMTGTTLIETLEI
jgi:D-glycero-alpha-D-manno-heptose-7-phosphate kinase